MAPIKESTSTPSQRISWICNSNGRVRIPTQTPEIITETYGAPRGGHYYDTDKSRSFYKLPFCHERKQFPEEVDYAMIEAFYNKLKEIDTLCGSDEFKVKMFWKTRPSLSISPLFESGWMTEKRS